MTPLAQVTKLATICISYKFGHQMAPPQLVANLSIRWHYILPWNDLLAFSVGIEFVSSSAKVRSVKSAKVKFQTDIGTHRSDPRYTWGPLKSNFLAL